VEALIRKLDIRFLVGASLLVLVGCGTQKTGKPLRPSAAQALRTCVDRWNQGRMRGWGPALASVGRRRLDAKRLAAVGLRPGPRRCVVSVAFEYPLGAGERCSSPAHRVGRRTCVERSRTWSCAIGRFGAYVCPLRHEPDYVPLRNQNATVDGRGHMKLDVPLEGTHPPPRLAWQRYPRIDGFVEPWTRSGTLRAGLRFRSTLGGGGACSSGSEMVDVRSAVRCLWRGLYQVDPCFVPPGRWNHRGGVVACPDGTGATTFGRFVIGPPSYRAIDFPVLIPWMGIGAISLGERRAEVVHDYDAIGHRYHVQVRSAGLVQGYYRLHHSRVFVTFEDGRVNELDFTTRYYRTWDGFGVGSRIPLGPCHRTARTSCEHRWRGFVWNAWVREKPCSCWVKVGDRKRSLPATGANFLKHWTFIHVRHGRVTRIFMARRFVD
jgi:hypothetical protein